MVKEWLFLPQKLASKFLTAHPQASRYKILKTIEFKRMFLLTEFSAQYNQYFVPRHAFAPTAIAIMHAIWTHFLIASLFLCLV